MTPDQIYAKYAATLEPDYLYESEQRKQQKANRYLNQLRKMFATHEEYKAFLRSKTDLIIRIN